ncbi:MAG: motility protein A [Firmicutes bacterium HGW-Firmicutes-1]|jgi:chemotaxis protein MotA|nr:MAG: motility protein A [Firmicutes bacterium HGW-Firmicutes-1]
MDLATIIGLVAAIVFVAVSILLNGSLLTFWDAPSAMIVFGGAFSAVLVSYPLDRYINSLKAISLVFKNQTMDEGTVIKKIIELSNVARKEGLLALEEATESIDDDFLKKGILLIVDGTDPELVRNILETELIFIQTRHGSIQGFYDKLGELGPAWGMIGTLIGLINMLKNMNDPSSIGPSMAVALITTLYGSILANLFAIPFSSKMKIRSGDEVLLKEVMIEGLLSIQAGENPRVIEEKLKAFLSPILRKSLTEAEGTEGDA